MRNSFAIRLISKAVITLLIILSTYSCQSRNDYSIIIMSDLHYDSTSIRVSVLDSVINYINVLEKEAQEEIPPIKFVSILGDITETGTSDEWKKYTEAFGIQGEKKIKYPVYETFGNHDGNINGVVRSGIAERNRIRENLISISDNGLNCSWNQGSIHFVSLGIYPGLEWDPDCEWCHYFKESFRDPQMSLLFLKNDLAKNLSSPDQPVVLFFHYGWDDFSLLWWTKTEQERFYKVIEDYNISAIFHGHNHSAEHYKWQGIDIWSSGSPQRGDRTGNFLLVSFSGDSITVRITEL